MLLLYVSFRSCFKFFWVWKSVVSFFFFFFLVASWKFMEDFVGFSSSLLEVVITWIIDNRSLFSFWFFEIWMDVMRSFGRFYAFVTFLWRWLVFFEFLFKIFSFFLSFFYLARLQNSARSYDLCLKFFRWECGNSANMWH